MQKKNKSTLRISKKKNAEAKPQKTAEGAAKAIKYKANLATSLATRANDPRSVQERIASRMQSKIASKRNSRGGMPSVAQATFSTTDQFRKTRKSLTIAKKKAGY